MSCPSCDETLTIPTTFTPETNAVDGELLVHVTGDTTAAQEHLDTHAAA